MSEDSRWAVAVVVPARNEQRLIGRCIAAVRRSLASCPLVAESWVVVVADACHDGTVTAAREALGSRGTVVSCDATSAGAARKVGGAAVLAHFAAWRPNCLWIANTDADSAPDEDWISQQVSLAIEGYCGVAGIVRIDGDATISPARQRMLMQHYTVHADGSHPHVHGANLGIRADAYSDVGGWSESALGEDGCLWSRLRSRLWLVTSSTRGVVTTSGRLEGRAPGGFADVLRTTADSLAG